jgi:hypothetical protein
MIEGSAFVARMVLRRCEAALGGGGKLIADADAAFVERFQNEAPMDVGFGECATDAEDPAVAVVAPEAPVRVQAPAVVPPAL